MSVYTANPQNVNTNLPPGHGSTVSNEGGIVVTNPYGIGALSAGTASALLGTIILSNSNGVSFGLSGNTLTASAVGGGGAGGVAISANASSMTTGTIVFSNANNFSFGLLNGTMTGSYTVPSVPSQTSLSFSNLNGVSFGTNGSTLTASVAAQSLQTQGSVLVNGSSGSIVFSNANNHTFGANGSTITLSYSQSVQTQNGVSVQGSTGNFSFGNANGVTFGGNNSTITASVASTFAYSQITDVNTGGVGVGQALLYNGAQFAPGNVQGGGAGAGVELFFSDTASDISTYKSIPQTPSSASESDNGIVVNNNTVLFASYASDSAGLGGTSIDAGVWALNTYCYVSGTGGVTQLTFDFYKRTTGGTETLLFSVASGDINNTAVALLTLSTVQQAFAINATDRLVIKVSGTTTNVGAITVHFVYAGTTHYSNVQTPLVIRHNALIGLQGGQASQYFHLNSTEYQNLSQRINAISAGTASFISGTAVFSNINGISFGLNGSTITASHNGITLQSVQTQSNIQGILAGTTSANTGNLVFSNSNGFSFGMNGQTITGSYTAVTETPFGISAGTQSVSTGTMLLSNSNGISFGMSVSSRITASFDGIKSISAGTTRITNNEVVLSNLNGFSFGANGQAITASYTVPSVAGLLSAINLSAGTTSQNVTNFVLSNSNNFSFGLNGSTVTGSYSQSAQTQSVIQAISAGTTSANSGNITFSNANAVSFGMAAGVITASITAQSNQNISLFALGNTVQNSSTVLNASNLSFNGLGNMTVGFSNGSINLSVTSANQSVQTLGVFALGNTTQSSSGTQDARSHNFLGAGVVSVGITGGTIVISAPAAAGDGVNIIAAGSQTAASTGTVLFANANNITFGMGASSVVTASASFPAQSAQTLGLSAFGNTTQGSTTTIDARAIQLNGAGNISVGFSNGSIVYSVTQSAQTQSNIQAISAGTTSANSGNIVFSNSNNFSFGLNGQTVTGSFSQTSATNSFYQHLPADLSILHVASIGSLSLYPMKIPYQLTGTVADIFVSIAMTSSGTSNTTFSGSFTFSAALYSNNAGTLSMASSGSQQYTYSYTSNQSNSSISGMRRLTIPININATPGVYWYGLNYSFAAGSGSMTHSMMGAGAFSTAYSGQWGQSQNSTNQIVPYAGVYRTTTGAFPSAISVSEIYAGAGNATQSAARPVQLILRNISAV